MRALRSCDFCDADAVGTFEIVPPELDPTEAEQRRVVLCADCSARLETLLEPLLDRLTDADAIAETTTARTGESSNADSTDSRKVAQSIDESTEPIAIESDESSDSLTLPESDEPVAASADESTASSDTETSTVGRDADESTAEAATEEPTAATDTDDSIVFSDAETADPMTDGEESTTSGSEESGSESPPDQEQLVDSASPDPRSPAAYQKVLRLLRNRDLPMDRAVLESLAAGAYDLESHEIEAIVDHAIENGDLVADGDQLRLS